MRKVFILVLACAITILSTTATAQTRRRSAARRSAAKATAAKAAAEKSAAEIKASRDAVTAQIKTLTHFLYLFGSIAKGIESIDQASGKHEASPSAIEQNERNKTKVRESIRNVRQGLDKLERDFRANPALAAYYASVAGLSGIGEAAENQAAANRFDEAGRSLLKAVDQLTDALAAMR